MRITGRQGAQCLVLPRAAHMRLPSRAWWFAHSGPGGMCIHAHMCTAGDVRMRWKPRPTLAAFNGQCAPTSPTRTLTGACWACNSCMRRHVVAVSASPCGCSQCLAVRAHACFCACVVACATGGTTAACTSRPELVLPLVMWHCPAPCLPPFLQRRALPHTAAAQHCTAAAASPVPSPTHPLPPRTSNAWPWQSPTRTAHAHSIHASL